MESKNALKLFTGLVCVAIVGVLMLYSATTTKRLGEKSPASFSELGGDFTLQAANGNVSLSDFKGKTVVMYFGFMTCPEVCPNSMGTIKQAFEQLSEAHLANTQGIMISIDPERDKPEALHEFTQYFHKNIIGITGEQTQLDEIGRRYGAYFEKEQNDENGYLFRHSSRYYVINKQGELIDAMRHSTTSNELLARLREALGS